MPLNTMQTIEKLNLTFFFIYGTKDREENLKWKRNINIDIYIANERNKKRNCE